MIIMVHIQDMVYDMVYIQDMIQDIQIIYM